MSETLTSVTAAERALSASLIKNSSLSKVSELYKGMTQKGVAEKELQTVPFGSEVTVFDKNMDILDISQQAYLLQSGFKKINTEKDSFVNILKSEKKESSLMTYTLGTVSQKKENTAVYGAMLNSQNNRNTGILGTVLTGTQMIGQEKGGNTPAKTSAGFNAFF